MIEQTDRKLVQGMDLYYVIEENGYHIYDRNDRLFHIQQFEPYIPDPSKSYEENAKKQIEKLLAAADEVDKADCKESELSYALDVESADMETAVHEEVNTGILSLSAHKKKIDVVKIVLGVFLAVMFIAFGVTTNNYTEQINLYKTQVANLEKRISELSVTDGYYQQIIETCGKGNVGWASPDFRLSEGVICLQRGASDTVTLYTNISGTVYHQNSNSSVGSIAFQQHSWKDSVILNVTAGNTSGTSVITFTNSKNTDELRLIIIVTD